MEKNKRPKAKNHIEEILIVKIEVGGKWEKEQANSSWKKAGKTPHLRVQREEDWIF